MTKVTHLTLDERGDLSRKRIHLREISGEADTPLDTVGQDLRAARLRRGHDLATVSRALKIRKDHLEAIEEDRLEALPGRAYAVGFVRSYADYLGLQPAQCVERYKLEIAGRGEPAAPIGIADAQDERRLPHGWIVIAVVVLGVLAYAAYYLSRSADTLMRQPIAPVPARIAPPVVAAFHRPPPPQVPGSQTAAVTAPKTVAPVAGPLPGSSAAPVPQSRQSAAQPAASVDPAQQLAALPAGQVFGNQNKDARVILHARALTRVLVEDASGRVFINRLLHPGDSYRVPDKVGLTLTVSDGAAVALELDGQVMGNAGTPGKVTEGLSLDPQAIVDHYGGTKPG